MRDPKRTWSYSFTAEANIQEFFQLNCQFKLYFNITNMNLCMLLSCVVHETDISLSGSSVAHLIKHPARMREPVMASSSHMMAIHFHLSPASSLPYRWILSLPHLLHFHVFSLVTNVCEEPEMRSDPPETYNKCTRRLSSRCPAGPLC